MAQNGFLTNRRELKQAVIGFITLNGTPESPVAIERLVIEIPYVDDELATTKAIASIVSKLTKEHRHFHRKYVRRASDGRQVLGYYFDFLRENPNYGVEELKGRRPDNGRKYSEAPSRPLTIQPVTVPVPWGQALPAPVSEPALKACPESAVDEEDDFVLGQMISCYRLPCGVFIPVELALRVQRELAQIDPN